MDSGRFERQTSFFGKKGQNQIRDANVAVVGSGGLGSHVIQQLAFLGVGSLTVIDFDNLEKTNLNRLIGACHDAPIPGTKKVDIAKRLIDSIDQSIIITTVPDKLISKESFSGIKKSDYVFGCVDNDGARLVLNELCIAFEIPYFDLASDINEENGLTYGGRVFVNFDDKGCLYCYDLISIAEANMELSSPEQRKDHEKIYGVSMEDLDETGPSVVSINGVIASLAVTEFMAMVTELRQPNRLLHYSGHRGIVTKNIDEPQRDCYYCNSVRGQHENANVDRYLESSH